MIYPSKRASDVYAKDLTHLIKSNTLYKFTYTGTEEEVRYLRSRALSYARCRDIIITTTKVNDGAIRLRYGGKLRPKKRLQYTR